MKFAGLLLYVRDLDMSLGFYSAAGAEVLEQNEKMATVSLAGLTLQLLLERSSHFNSEGKDLAAPKGVGVFHRFLVPDLEERHATFVACGYTPSSEPRDLPWGDREFAIRDPDGYVFVFIQERA